MAIWGLRYKFSLMLFFIVIIIEKGSTQWHTWYYYMEKNPQEPFVLRVWWCWRGLGFARISATDPVWRFTCARGRRPGRRTHRGNHQRHRQFSRRRRRSCTGDAPDAAATTCPRTPPTDPYTAGQRQKAVSAHLESGKILPFVILERYISDPLHLYSIFIDHLG